jgi:putative Holliday junction resolvase
VRVAAVDYGRRRVGLAISDALGITVRGLATVVRAEADDDGVAATARALAAEGLVERVVVGLPLHDDGRESEMSKEARGFGASLSAALGVEVVFFDEGLTSWEAEEGLKAKGKRLRDARRAGDVDREAAMALLRSYLRESSR